MSGGSQHNPNGRQPQLGAGWSPLQLQVASFLARAPQAHMASERGVTWHTPTPPPHLYHVPAPSPPDPLQAMKAGGNSVFRHTATPPELYRHTPTPPDKHLMRHTPSPGDVKAGTALPPAELYPHLGPTRDKLVRPEELLSYARGGVDLSLGGARGANGAAGSPAPPHAPHPAHAAHPAHPSPALSVRDAPTINSLIARAQPRHPHARVDALLERLVPSPVSPHSVIMHSRAAPTPSPPSSNEDSADSCGAPPGSKRKRKPERTIRVSAPPPPAPSDPPRAAPTPPAHSSPREPQPVENGDATYDTQNEPDKIKCEDLKPEKPPSPPPQQAPEPHARRKSRSASAETIDDIAAMIASADQTPTEPDKPAELEIVTPVTIDKLKSVLTSPDSKLNKSEDVKKSPPKEDKEKDVPPETPVEETAAAPKRRSTRTSNSESTNVPVASPSEAKPAEPEASEVRSTEPTASSFVEVENQLEKMFAGLEEEPSKGREGKKAEKPNKAKKRRKSAPTKGESKAARRASRASLGEERRKGARKKGKKDGTLKDAYDSGSNASSSRSRGPYIQIRGPRDSPLSVSVINASTGDDDGEASTSRRKGGEEFRNGLRARGLHASTLGLRYDATTPDATWLCAFCERGPHAAVLGDLFGPYTVETDCDEYRILDEATRRRYESATTPNEVWFHEACAVWAPGLVAAGARLWGLAGAVWAARGARCCACGKAGAGVACAERGCRARVHVPCAPAAQWTLNEEQFRGVCARHA